MREVELSLERLREINEEINKVKAVQTYLIEWCVEHVKERPISTIVSKPAVYNSVEFRGIMFEFREPQNAMMFKLRWA